MTGPLRMIGAPVSQSGAAGAAAATAATLPGTHARSTPPCANSPRIFLDFADALPRSDAQAPPRVGPYGSGNPALDAQAAAQAFGSVPPAMAAAAAETGAAARPLRLVVYQKYKITLFLVVEDPPVSPSSSESPAAASATAACSPPLSFYRALESYMETNLRKLGELLVEQSNRMAGGAAAAAAAAAAGGAAASVPVPVEEPYRFLYFNHMNLALKTSLASGAPSSGKGGAGSSSGGGGVLSLDTIKLIRELHRDFNTPSFRQKQVAALPPSMLPPAVPPHLAHSVLAEGATEVCVRTARHGWVVGRRATQSHREFFLLLDDAKAPSLADIQEEVDNLARTYFYNIFIH